MTVVATSAPTSEEQRQFRLLFRAFVRQLFENDLVPDTVDLRQSVLSLAAIFIVPPALIAVTLLVQFGPWMTPEEVAVASLPHKLFFVGYSMAAVGLLTMLVWDAVFPDRRDMMVLGTLPVRGRTLVAAKPGGTRGICGRFHPGDQPTDDRRWSPSRSVVPAPSERSCATRSDI